MFKSTNDPYMSSDGEHTIVYVNDFVVAAKNLNVWSQRCPKSLKWKILVNYTTFLHGVKVIHDHKRGTVWIG